ncbi:flagellar biosynthetic protein FliO [Desulfitobacterium dichloroeliminans LMG P-21439]|uniref:Flagellar protein n=1 Tax=Desulfitobacterium dichloroeliminans (strain LMG P-21439 / DCA1) TaxID=871963 RepID=U3GKG1_DESDL|nr:flagellar biosynthetic protein FliO [Desulfitobacterium dichloroeliminans]AGA70274.1 flagellar biosynthetic protein FliO [Desulfitobacterium dichloroeliminans LMG P-21439]
MPYTQVSIDDATPYQGQLTETVSQTGLDSSYWGGLVGTILIFILILVVALWVIRRMNQASYRGMQAPWARVLDRQMLNTNQSLYLVEVAGKLQVLAGTDHHLTKIDEINDPELAAEILDELAHRPAERAENIFAGIAKQAFGSKRGKGKEPFEDELERLLEEVER